MLTRRQWIARSLSLLAAAAIGSGSGCRTVAVSSSAPPPPSAPLALPNPGLTFPRSATHYLDQHDLPPIEELARYDVVVINNEWANRKPRVFFDDLRTRNPRMRLLAYVNVVDSLLQTGTEPWWRNTYRLWQIDSSDSSRNYFPDEWLARTASGAPVHEWQDNIMTNLTDQAPRVNAQLFAEYAADWIISTVWPVGIWDGVFLDVWGEWIYTADSNHWDINRDGRDETDSEIYGPGNPLDRGLTIAERRLRAAMPDAILVANANRTLRDGLLNGLAFESFADPASGRDPDTDLQAYLAAAVSAGARSPRMNLTINPVRARPGSEDEFRRARFELGLTLLQDGYWAPVGLGYGELRYYDELDGGGLGRGYLGHPIDSNPALSSVRGVFRRDFDQGIVLVNTSNSVATVPLERAFTKLTGLQDPIVNDGATVTSVELPATDALVLLK